MSKKDIEVHLPQRDKALRPGDIGFDDFLEAISATRWNEQNPFISWDELDNDTKAIERACSLQELFQYGVLPVFSDENGSVQH